jgi:NO-binding membrane sensor protein with MHYT domain
VTFLYDVVLTLHFLGMALLVGGFFAQMGASPRTVSHWMRGGVLTQLITGMALAGMAGSKVGTTSQFDAAAVGVKLAITLVITVVVLAGARQEQDKQQPYWAAAGALALVNVLVAVFWVAGTAVG